MSAVVGAALFDRLGLHRGFQPGDFRERAFTDVLCVVRLPRFLRRVALLRTACRTAPFAVDRLANESDVEAERVPRSVELLLRRIGQGFSYAARRTDASGCASRSARATTMRVIGCAGAISISAIRRPAS